MTIRFSYFDLVSAIWSNFSLPAYQVGRKQILSRKNNPYPGTLCQRLVILSVCLSVTNFHLNIYIYIYIFDHLLWSKFQSSLHILQTLQSFACWTSVGSFHLLLIFIEKFLHLPGFEPETSPLPSRYATSWAILAWIFHIYINI